METKFLEIKGITLLSVEEARKLPQTISDDGKWWWLRSPGYYSDAVAYVDVDGSVIYSGTFVSFEDGGVRPVLILSDFGSLNLEKFKDSIEVFDREWIYIGDGMALAEKPIFRSRFDKYSNDYETSEIKQKLENWLEEQIEILT